MEISTSYHCRKRAKQSKTHRHNFASSSTAKVPLFVAPVSPYHLIQERFYDNPWKLLCSCLVLQHSRARSDTAKLKMQLTKFFQKYETPPKLMKAKLSAIKRALRPLKVPVQYAGLIRQFSSDYVRMNWTSVKELPGMDDYADQSYRIFCLGEWAEVRPKSKELLDYQHWMFLNCGGSVFATGSCGGSDNFKGPRALVTEASVKEKKSNRQYYYEPYSAPESEELGSEELDVRPAGHSNMTVSLGKQWVKKDMRSEAEDVEIVLSSEGGDPLGEDSFFVEKHNIEGNGQPGLVCLSPNTGQPAKRYELRKKNNPKTNRVRMQL